MNELLQYIAKKHNKADRTIRKWKADGLPSRTKKWLAANGKVSLRRQSYWLTLDRKEFEITGKLAGDIVTWQELTRSIAKANKKLKTVLSK